MNIGFLLTLCLCIVAGLFLMSDTTRAESVAEKEQAWNAELVKFLAASRREHDHRFKSWETVADWNFDDGKMPDGFKVFEGEWEVVDGKLCANGGKPMGNRIIQFGRPQWPAMRIEFDATLTARPGELPQKICDLGIRINADPETASFAKGYVTIIGAYYNQASVIHRLNIPFARTEYKVLKPGVTHKVAVEIVKPHIRVFVDDTVVIEAWERSGTSRINHSDFLDMDPTKILALSTYDTDLKIDNLKILVPGEK